MNDTTASTSDLEAAPTLLPPTPGNPATPTPLLVTNKVDMEAGNSTNPLPHTIGAAVPVLQDQEGFLPLAILKEQVKSLVGNGLAVIFPFTYIKNT